MKSLNRIPEATMTSPSPNNFSGREAASLEGLPSELVVQVASSLGLSSTLALASTSTSLANILTSTTEWTKILQKMFKYEAVEEVKELASFLRTMKEPGELLDLLLHHICSPAIERYTRNSISISCSLHQHQVSPQGMHLLHLATSAMSAEPWTITEVRTNFPPRGPWGVLRGVHLVTLMSWVEKQEQQVTSLYVKDMECRTSGIRKDINMNLNMNLLEKCTSWEIQCLEVLPDENQYEEEDVGMFWRRLAEATGKGKIDKIDTCRKVMVQGEVQDLRRVWEATQKGWWIWADMFRIDKIIIREDGVEVDNDFNVQLRVGWEEVVRELEEKTVEEESNDSFDEEEGGDDMEGCDVM